MAQYIKTEEGYKGLEESISAVTDNKMDKTNPTGTGSFSMNRKPSTVVGIDSHTEGNWTTASGIDSHAEGNNTTASEYSAHAEGTNTTASGRQSHAEGNSTNTFSSVVTIANPTTEDIITAWTSKKFSVAKGSYSHVEGNNNLALGNYSHAEGNETVARGYISHAEGQITTASGDQSHAEGNNTTASGQSSHAEGDHTTASGFSSHAEGSRTTASGNSSHAEGNSTLRFSSVVISANPTIDFIMTNWKTQKFSVAKGDYSHVEGKDNLALDNYSHAEGNETIARGYSSHAEGNNTTASGGRSHAEGYCTIANGTDSHVQGKYNIADTSSIYADIIGNGKLVNGTIIKRSNAATVDWNGNAWFAGDVYTGSISGTNKDDGSKKLATEEYVNNSVAAGGTDISLGLTSAVVGQIIKVKAIDENGKPTEWETADMQSGEASFPKFEKLLTHTITEEEIAANPVAFVWGTAQIPNLNDFNVFTMTIRNPDNTTKITFTKWVKLTINNIHMGGICGTSQGAKYKYSISANRLYGFWVSENIYNPQNSTGTVLTPPYSNTTFDTTLAASEAVTSIGFTSYGGDYGLTAGIIVEIWGAK